MSTFEKPQIIVHIQKGLNYTVFDCKWVPCSAKFVTMGNFARGTGVIQVYEIQRGDLKLLREEFGSSRDASVFCKGPQRNHKYHRWYRWTWNWGRSP